MKKLLSLIIISILTLSFASCSSSKVAANAPKQTLVFGAMGSIDVVPIVIATEKGFFKEEGLDLNLQIFKNSKDRDAALQAGSLDGIIGDQVAICLYQNADFDMKITGVTNGDFMLVASAKSGIKSVEDLSGKSAAISEKTAIEYTLDKVLEKNCIETSDVKKIAVPAIPARLEMLRSNNVDTALLPEPFSSLAIKDGGILLGSAAGMGAYPSVTAFTQKSINEKANELKAFYRAYNKAVEYINSTPITEYEDIIIKTVGYPEDMKGKITLPKFTKNTLPAESDLKAAIDWTTKNGLLKKELKPADLMNSIGTK